MLVETLYELHDKRSFTGADELKAGLLLQAITDWPRKVDTIEEFLAQVMTFLQVKLLTYDDVQKALRELKPNTAAWEMESISSLLELLEVIQGQRLNKISIVGNTIDFDSGSSDGNVLK